MDLAVTFEDTGVSAYNGAGPSLKSKDLLGDGRQHRPGRGAARGRDPLHGRPAAGDRGVRPDARHGRGAEGRIAVHQVLTRPRVRGARRRQDPQAGLPPRLRRVSSMGRSRFDPDRPAACPFHRSRRSYPLWPDGGQRAGRSAAPWPAGLVPAASRRAGPRLARRRAARGGTGDRPARRRARDRSRPGAPVAAGPRCAAAPAATPP